ncbi:chitin-binding protein [Streptomyces sp. SID8379]|uniref:lytic polysaccharide monooxygenase auxiliary activity family 9 protein n=1 Tax=unclassified Streptomyces TaxID=2593676 RepID=UPI0003A98396|nr:MULTISPECIES: lytic polysaccharide monooxygenase [unclassified Streptomyces]MYW69722.1 chitin-binding protein [Streptomyces sp. SID8379]
MNVPRRPAVRPAVRPTARRAAGLVGAAGLAVAAVLAVPSPAAAHGVALMPGSRTYLCYKDLLANSSTQLPTNPACKAAVQAAGTTPLYNWFAVLDSNAGGRGEGYVADGTLCSAGDRSPYDFSPYDAARTDWPLTHLTAGATLQVKYSNWAQHPGRFEVYVTKDGFDPERPLGWSDLEKVQTVQDPPHDGGPGTEAGHYYWDLTLPERTGRHMVFVQWVRSDSQENFFSCSDVVFDGGNGEVTGLTGGEQSATEASALGTGAAHGSHASMTSGPHHAASAPNERPDAAGPSPAASGASPAGALTGVGASAAVLAASTVFYVRHRRRTAEVPVTPGRPGPR